MGKLLVDVIRQQVTRWAYRFCAIHHRGHALSPCCHITRFLLAIPEWKRETMLCSCSLLMLHRSGFFFLFFSFLGCNNWLKSRSFGDIEGFESLVCIAFGEIFVVLFDFFRMESRTMVVLDDFQRLWGLITSSISSRNVEI